MTRSIDRDLGRFKQILRGKVRENLRKYITHGEMIGRTGRELVSIPVPAIDIPHFRHGQKGSGGVGQGEGDVGQPIGKGQGQDGDGQGQAGDQPGAHIREVEISLEELADMLGEALELPRIEPKGKDSLESRKDRYTSIRQTGPDSLRHFKRTFKRALKRQVTLDDYNYEKPVVIPMREDERFRSWKTVTEPESNAAVIYIMDVSGLDDRRPERDRAHRVVLDRYLAQAAIRRRAAALHRARRGRPRSRRRHVLPHARKRRDAHLVGLPGRLADHHPRLPSLRLEHLLLPVLRRRQLGRGQRRLPQDPHGQPAPVAATCSATARSRVPTDRATTSASCGKSCDKFDNLILSEIDGKEAIYDSIKEFLGTGK